MTGVTQQHFEKFENGGIIVDDENLGAACASSMGCFSGIALKATYAEESMGTQMLNIEPCPARDFTSMG